MLATFSFFSTLYLKQQANFLSCFSSLKFENSLCSNKLFRCIFGSERKIYTAEMTKQSILFKTALLNSHFSLFKLLDFGTTAIKYVSLSMWIPSKDFFTIQETACSSFVLGYERPPHQIEYII